LLPLVLQGVRGWFRRGMYAAAAVLLAGFGGTRALEAVATEESPLTVSTWLWRSATAQGEPGLLALVLAAGAALLPLCLRRGELAIAALGAGLLVGALAAAPGVSALGLVAGAWITTAALLAQWRRNGGEPTRIHSLGAISRTTLALFVDRVKPVGGPRRPRARGQGGRWPQALGSRRLGHATRR
jgi:hypothetical protein